MYFEIHGWQFIIGELQSLTLGVLFLKWVLRQFNDRS